MKMLYRAKLVISSVYSEQYRTVKWCTW